MKSSKFNPNQEVESTVQYGTGNNEKEGFFFSI